MRFADKGLTQTQVTKLLEELWEVGVTSHHSSLEYNSYPLYTAALKKSSVAGKIKHITKLSSPHFEDDEFSAVILEKRVDAELKTLQIECIDVLQWLVRSKPINDADRLQTLVDKKEEIKETFKQLKQKGKIKSVFSFPYSVPFAKEVIKISQVDGIMSYLNKEELAYTSFAEEEPFIAIRPFFAGKILKGMENIDQVIKDQLKFVEAHKNVYTTVVGINSLEQVKTYKNYLK